MASMLEAASDTAVASLRSEYGMGALLFGAPAVVQRLAGMPVEDDSLFRAARAIAAVDYHRLRSAPPRFQPGGSTNPFNRKRWSELGPYLRTRLGQVLPDYVAGSLLARAVFTSTTDDRPTADEIGRRVKRQFDATNMFESVQVDVQIPASTVGGAAWLRDETLGDLERARTALADNTPVLLEVIRDPMAAPLSAQLVVLFRIDESGGDRMRLSCYDPALADRLVRFDLWIGADTLKIYDADLDDERVAPKGLRFVALPDATPPLFGLRRYTRRLLPWRLSWRLKRRWQTLAMRKRERRLAASSERSSDRLSERSSEQQAEQS